MIARQLLHPWVICRERIPVRPVDRAEMLVLIVSVCALLLAGMLTMAVDRPSPTTSLVSVRSGDTLWSLAAEYGDPNKYILERVTDLRAANGIKSGQPLYEGQMLMVPNVQHSASPAVGGIPSARRDNFQRSTAGG